MRIKLILGVAALVIGGAAFLAARSNRKLSEALDDVFEDGEWWHSVWG
jgi:hypothetical protein